MEEDEKVLRILRSIKELRIERKNKGELDKRKHALLNKYTAFVEKHYQLSLIYDEDRIKIADSQPAIRQMKNIRPYIQSVKEGNNEGRLFHFMFKIFRFTITEDSAKRYFYQE